MQGKILYQVWLDYNFTCADYGWSYEEINYRTPHCIIGESSCHIYLVGPKVVLILNLERDTPIELTTKTSCEIPLLDDRKIRDVASYGTR